MELQTNDLIKEFKESLKGTELENYSEETIRQVVTYPFFVFKRHLANNELKIFKLPYLGTLELVFDKVKYAVKNIKNKTELTASEVDKITKFEQALEHLKNTERKSFLKNRYNYVEKENEE
jgi:hypothetical protein